MLENMCIYELNVSETKSLTSNYGSTDGMCEKNYPYGTKTNLITGNF